MMNEFPYTNFHELNTDWLIKMCKTIRDEIDGITEKAEQAVDEARAAQYVVFPPIEDKTDWTIYRILGDTTTGIEFTKDAPYAKIIHNNSRYPVLSSANPPDAQMINDLQIDQMIVARTTVDYDTTYKPQEETLFSHGIRAILIPNDRGQYDQMHLLYKKTTSGVSYVDSLSFTQTGEGVGVISINGRTGVLTLSDIGACPAINDEAATSSAPWSGERTYQTIESTVSAAIEEALDGTTISEIQSSIRALQNSFVTLSATVNRYGTRIATTETGIEEIKTRLTSAENRMTTAETNIGTINTTLNNVNSSINTLTGNVNTNTSAIAKNTSDIDLLDERLGDIEETLPDPSVKQFVKWSTTFNDAAPSTIATEHFGNVVVKVNNVPDGYSIIGIPFYAMYLGSTSTPTGVANVNVCAITGGMNDSGIYEGIPTVNFTVYNPGAGNITAWVSCTFFLVYTGRNSSTDPNPFLPTYSAT